MSEKKLLSTSQVAELLGISRVSVFNKIKKGEIKAVKVGRSYVIETEDISGKNLSIDEKKQVVSAVDRAVREYGEVLKRLGRKNAED